MKKLACGLNELVNLLWRHLRCPRVTEQQHHLHALYFRLITPDHHGYTHPTIYRNQATSAHQNSGATTSTPIPCSINFLGAALLGFLRLYSSKLARCRRARYPQFRCYNYAHDLRVARLIFI